MSVGSRSSSRASRNYGIPSFWRSHIASTRDYIQDPHGPLLLRTIKWSTQMFQQAANLYKQCATSVYGVTTQRKLGRFGQGCLLSPIHAITCEHVVSEIERRGSQILVVQPDGFFHCKVLFRDAASDIAIIETGASFHPFNQLPFEVFPGFSRQIPSLGMTVGYPAKLFKNGADNKE